MFAQVGGIVHANMYRADDRPRYRHGNKQLTAICASNNVIYLLAKGCYIWRNKQRDREWNALSREEQVHYLETTTDAGRKRKDFRFAH
ncbi:hypothetical protein MRS44_009693 [Fusarium solani]|uniref:Uncharacterized protein n=1 Tax=Fusarium solani TaxID=169388 RepID=A0A9P9HLE3_FUSSL|nr:uncharacterized protein B0J15DRAFT_594942 [Fusarium solani]KAH7258802.1 hypothetical protein B0J15DRAFT_594942 [Fusarium solani]KAJ3461140.1 hypothetical protein MRS44_009693 [Fusarium solani]